MRITWKTLGALIDKMSEEQQATDVTVEVESDECYCAELRIAGSEHQGGLDEDHPVLFINYSGEHERRDDVDEIVHDIGLGE